MDHLSLIRLGVVLMRKRLSLHPIVNMYTLSFEACAKI